MRRFMRVAGAAVALLLMLPAVPAAATPPSEAEIVVPGFAGTFTATGPAVDDSVICGSGEVADTYVKGAGFQSGRGFNLTVGKQFTCADGSGTFDAKLQVRIDFARGVMFHWVITEGSGDYVDLHGTGSGFVVPVDTDVYQGAFHID